MQVPDLNFLRSIEREGVRVRVSFPPGKGTVWETIGALPILSKMHHEAGYVSDPSWEAWAGYPERVRTEGVLVRLTDNGRAALAAE